MLRRFTILVIGLLLSAYAGANHYSGGQIRYTHIGDSTGLANHYLIELSWIIHSQNLAATTTSQQVCVRSSCFPNFSFMLSHQSPPQELRSPIDYRAFQISGQDECVDQNALYSKELAEYRFQGSVVLPGSCGDYIFSAESDCCREDYDNLEQSIAKPVYVEAELNNLIGSNNNPEFQGRLAQVFCNRVSPSLPQFEFAQNAIDEDGDSLIYELVSPEYGATCGPAQAIAYSANFNAKNPILSYGPVIFDSIEGVLRFKPAAVGNYLLKLKVKEYRKDALNRYIFIGSAQRELNLSVTDYCKSEVNTGPGLLTNALDSLESFDIRQRDSLMGQLSRNDLRFINSGNQSFSLPKLKAQTCFSKSIKLVFDEAVYCSSIQLDDFEVLDPHGRDMAIDSIVFDCKQDNVQEAELYLKQAMVKDGHYVLLIKEGSDRNTLLNRCFFESIAGSTYLIPSYNCPSVNYQWSHCSINEDVSVALAWTPEISNDSILQNHPFRWELSREHPNGQITPLWASNEQLYPGPFYDNFHHESSRLDRLAIEYRIQFFLEGSPFPVQKIRPMLLESVLSVDEIGFQWNTYKGAKAYRLEEAVYLEDGSLQSLVWNKGYLCESNKKSLTKRWNFKDSTAAYRVLALGENGQPISESNYIHLKGGDVSQAYYSDWEEMPLCNFFSPNGDGINDRFFVYFPPKLRAVTSLELEVYNRHGVLCHRDPEFHLRNNSQMGWDGSNEQGQKCTEGVYYYILSIRDQRDGKLSIRRENLSIRP